MSALGVKTGHPPSARSTAEGRHQVSCGHFGAHLARKGRSNPGQRPALLNDFASSPAALKAAMACFVVMATVVFVSVLLPPAAPTIAIDNAISLLGHSIITNQSSSPNVR